MHLLYPIKYSILLEMSIRHVYIDTRFTFISPPYHRNYLCNLHLSVIYRHIFISFQHRHLRVQFSVWPDGNPCLPTVVAHNHHFREEENDDASFTHLQRLHLRPHGPHIPTSGGLVSLQQP